MVALTRIWSGSTLVLEVLADVRGDWPGPSRVRLGEVFETLSGTWVQYGPTVDSPATIEVEIPAATPAQVTTIEGIVRGDYGDTFRLEAPDVTVDPVSLVPGTDGVAYERWPGPPGSRMSRVVLRFVRV